MAEQLTAKYGAETGCDARGFLCSVGDGAAIVNRLLPPRPVPKDQVWRLQTAAIEMDRLGLDSKAEELYREYMLTLRGGV